MVGLRSPGPPRGPPSDPSLARRQRSTGAIDSRLWSRGLPTWLPVARQLARTHPVIIPDLLWFGGGTSDAASADTKQRPSKHSSSTVFPRMNRSTSSAVAGFVALGAFLAPARQGRLVILGSPDPSSVWRIGRPSSNDLGWTPSRRSSSPSRPRTSRPSSGWPTIIPAASRPAAPETSTRTSLAITTRRRRHSSELEREHERYHAMTLATYAEAMVIWGAHGQVFPVANGEALAAHLNAEYRVIDDTSRTPSRATECGDTPAIRVSESLKKWAPQRGPLNS